MISTHEHVGGIQDFALFVELQQKFTGISNRLAELETEINIREQKLIQEHTADFVVLQETASALEAQLKDLFARHPEWCGEKKNVTTPYGAVEKRKATELQVDNPAMTVAMIEAKGKIDPQFKADIFLHVSTEPNLETLEQLSDEALKELGVKRVETERITVKAAKVNVAKAVKAANKAKA